MHKLLLSVPPKQVEECKETFKKDCHIEYHAVPRAETVRVCQEPLKRDCDAQGTQLICSTEYETVCETLYHENEVEDDVPECETQAQEACNDATGKCAKFPQQVRIGLLMLWSEWYCAPDSGGHCNAGIPS